MPNALLKILLKIGLIVPGAALIIGIIAFVVGDEPARLFARGIDFAGLFLIAVGCVSGFRFRGHPTEQYPRTVGAANLEQRARLEMKVYYLGIFGNTIALIVSGGLLLVLAGFNY